MREIHDAGRGIPLDELKNIHLIAIAKINEINKDKLDRLTATDTKKYYGVV